MVRFIFEYLFKYCTDSLLELDLCALYEFTTPEGHVALSSLCETNRKPFKHLETLYLNSCYLDNQSIKFNEIFPAVRSVQLFPSNQANFQKQGIPHNKLSNCRWFAEPFNNLQHLSLCILDNRGGGFQEEDVIASLKLNPNIRSLHLIWAYKPKVFAGLQHYV